MPLSATKELFWARAQSRTESLEGPVRSALLKVFRNIRDRVDEGTLKKLLAQGAVDEIVNTALSDRKLSNDFLPLRNSIRRTIESGFEKNIRDLPRQGKTGGVLSVTFNVRNPHVTKAIETVTSPAFDSIKASVRDMVHGIITEGLDARRSPEAIARDVRELIGLGPDQMAQVRNFRRALMGERDIEGYTLRDRRLDALLAKRTLSPQEIERYTQKYLDRRIASNAASLTRTIAFNSYKAGQHLVWEEVQDTDLVPDGYHLEKQWVQIDRPSAREDHTEMNGEQVPFDESYSNGSMIPGDQGEFNCGCVSLILVVRD